MWSNTRFEQRIAEKLKTQLEAAEGEALFANYVQLKNKLATVWESIIRAEPKLTDHGPRHIQNVLQNADKLIGDGYFTGVELYSLAIMILFHDVGNIFGRRGHERRIAEVYAEITDGMNPPNGESVIVVRGAGAHSGTARDGTRNTLEDVEALHFLKSEPVRLRELAGILRFADELAEG